MENTTNETAPKTDELTDAEMALIREHFGWYNDPKYPGWL